MYKYFKRAFDFMIALVALIVLFVPLVIVAIIIKLDSKGCHCKGEDYVEIPPVLENDHLVWCSIAVVDSDNADSRCV